MRRLGLLLIGSLVARRVLELGGRRRALRAARDGDRQHRRRGPARRRHRAVRLRRARRRGQQGSSRGADPRRHVRAHPALRVGLHVGAAARYAAEDGQLGLGLDRAEADDGSRRDGRRQDPACPTAINCAWSSPRRTRRAASGSTRSCTRWKRRPARSTGSAIPTSTRIKTCSTRSPTISPSPQKN